LIYVFLDLGAITDVQKPTDLIQLYYEIAMSIGLTLDLNKMLKVALTSYLKNLNCSAGAIIQLKKKSPKKYMFRKLYIIPRKLQENEVYRQVINLLSVPFDETELNTFKKKLPFSASQPYQST
jgi:hypothetical protein